MLAEQNRASAEMSVISGSSASKSATTALLSDASLKNYAEALRTFSSSEFNSTKWLVKTAEYHTAKEFSFSAFCNLSENLTMLVKCWVIHLFSLAYSLGTIKSKTTKISVFLNHFAIVKSRLEKLYENPTKNAAAIQFNEKYLQLYSSFTGRMSEKNESA